MECDSDYGDDSASQYSMMSQAPSFSRGSYLYSKQEPDQLSLLSSRRGSVQDRPPSVARQSSVSRMLLDHGSRAPSVSRYANTVSKFKSLDFNSLDDDDSSSVSSRYTQPSSRLSTSTLRKWFFQSRLLFFFNSFAGLLNTHNSHFRLA